MTVICKTLRILKSDESAENTMITINMTPIENLKRPLLNTESPSGGKSFY